MRNWKITDLSSASWALKQLRLIDSKKNNIDELANEEIKKLKLEILRVEKWAEKEKGKFNHSEEFFKGHLVNYYNENLEVDPAFRINTPNGKVSKRKQRAKVERDNDKLLEWLQSNKLNDFIKVEEKPQWGELKKNLIQKGDSFYTEDGEKVEGVTAVERPDKIDIKLD